MQTSSRTMKGTTTSDRGGCMHDGMIHLTKFCEVKVPRLSESAETEWLGWVRTPGEQTLSVLPWSKDVQHSSFALVRGLLVAVLTGAFLS